MKNYNNFSQLARKYGVTPHTIVDWCRSYGLPTTAKSLKQFKNNYIMDR